MILPSHIKHWNNPVVVAIIPQVALVLGDQRHPLTGQLLLVERTERWEWRQGTDATWKPQMVRTLEVEILYPHGGVATALPPGFWVIPWNLELVQEGRSEHYVICDHSRTIEDWRGSALHLVGQLVTVSGW